MSDYIPPNPLNVVLNFKGEYIKPNPNNVVLVFGEVSDKTQYIKVDGLALDAIGIPKFRGAIISLYPTSISPGLTQVSKPSLYNFHKFVSTSGLIQSVFGTTNIINRNRIIGAQGFNSLVLPIHKIYNLKQIISLIGWGENYSRYGKPFLLGGSRSLYVRGIELTPITPPKVVNTRANQNVIPGSIAPPSLPNPNVSPRIIYITGIVAWKFGIPFIQRNPSPKGFATDSYGTTWISHSPRYLTPGKIETYLSGYPKIFDPTQKISVTGVNTVIANGIFGDINLKNSRRIISVQSWISDEFGNWGEVVSTRRTIESKSFDSQSFGAIDIHNKIPSIVPKGISSQPGLNAISIGYRIRNIKPSGWYQPKIGSHTLTKTPELKVLGFNSLGIGNIFISNKLRNINASIGRDTSVFGSLTVWHFTRNFKPDGIAFNGYGTARIEHGQRLVLMGGLSHGLYGNNAWVSHGKRTLNVNSIDEPKIPIHRVGGTQRIIISGYIATLFGNRIIPESQLLYPQGFINTFGIPVIDLWKKYLKPTGFLSNGQEGGHRFGTHKFWNQDQYVIQSYDPDNGLVPPKWVGWTAIENRNKNVGVIGSNASRVATPAIDNKARPLYPTGINSFISNKLMIAYRIRHLKIQGLESPHIGSWGIVHNDALVIAPKATNSQLFGYGEIINTRRYFNRIGNFESLVMGKPMIADRIRKLSFENRYAIAPLYIPIHQVHLHTRYISEVGNLNNHPSFGNPALTIHWNIVTPRWTLRDAYGSPTVKNLTPELGTRGRNSEEFGAALIRLQWRPLQQQGSETLLVGKAEIAFRDRQFSIVGFTHWNIPRPKVVKTGIPSYYPQYIWLDAVDIDGASLNGHGIEEPIYQVSKPFVDSNVIFPSGFSATRYGVHYTQSNGILVQPGLQELTIGNHKVGLKNREIPIPSLGDSMVFGKPRLSPWTIWATPSAPDQAKANHPNSSTFQPINSEGREKVGEIFGRLDIALKHRGLSVSSIDAYGLMGSGHKVALRKRYIDLNGFGFRSQRTGIHVVGPFDQKIEQYDAIDTNFFGETTVKIPFNGPRHIRPNSIVPIAPGLSIVDFFNRNLFVKGSDLSRMGTQRGDDKPFMWQGLRVGPLVTGNYGGFDSSKYGVSFVSLKVRNLEVSGFESFGMQMDIRNFKGRLKVILDRKVIVITEQKIAPVSIHQPMFGLPNTWLKVQYIRPDGNSEQFRKGGGF